MIKTLRLFPLMAGLAFLSACAAFSPPQPYLPARGSVQAGPSVTVGQGENVYGIARDHNVSMRDIIVLNGLKPPFDVRAGQSLILPAGGSSFNGDAPVPSPAPLPGVDKNELPPITPAAVSEQPLAPLPPPPKPVTPLTAPQVSSAPVRTPPPTVAEPVQALNKPAAQPKAVETTVGEASGAETAAGAATDMQWPVQGPILSGFGPKGAGLNNDGVNIGAPKGAPVVAAAPGTVVYAGDEMKGFGNLVLIRHQGDWVTAYAHLDRVLVKKDSIVGQGDQIGTVGKTGNVSTPQLHFETRKGGKPVDPAGVVKGDN